MKETRNEFLKRYREADLALLSKGENRPFVENALAEMGIMGPEFAGRCLHL